MNLPKEACVNCKFIVHMNSYSGLFSTGRNFALGAEFFFVFLTLVPHESAQIMKNSAPRT